MGILALPISSLARLCPSHWPRGSKHYSVPQTPIYPPGFPTQAPILTSRSLQQRFLIQSPQLPNTLCLPRCSHFSFEGPSSPCPIQRAVNATQWKNSGYSLHSPRRRHSTMTSTGESPHLAPSAPSSAYLGKQTCKYPLGFRHRSKS